MQCKFQVFVDLIYHVAVPDYQLGDAGYGYPEDQELDEEMVTVWLVAVSMHLA